MPKIMVSLAQRFQPVSFQAGGAGAPAAHALARRVRRVALQLLL